MTPLRTRARRCCSRRSTAWRPVTHRPLPRLRQGTFANTGPGGDPPSKTRGTLDARSNPADDHCACETISRPARSPSSSPTSKGRRCCCTSWVRKRMQTPSPSTGTSCARRARAEGGVEVDNQGDAFFFAFATVQGAVAAAQAMTDALAPGPIHLRIGLHTGTPLVTDEGYVGDDVHLAARVGASGHGGQVVLSRTTGDLVDGFPLTDLGEHRLKDIAEPVSIFQLGSQRFPPLKTISNTNLPRPASSFVGRERELSELLATIHSARLVTLTGPGGSGKTRLALEAADNACPFIQGRRLLGRPCLAARPGACQRDDCPDGGIQERPRRAHRRARAAACCSTTWSR